MGQALRLNRIHRNFDTVNVLSNVNLILEYGEAAAVVGPSGCGKTTLLRIAGTLDTPSSGDVEVDGTSVNKLSQREIADLRWSKIGFSFQEPALIENLTALENIMIPCLPRVKSDNEWNKFMVDALEIGEKLRLRARMKSRVNHLSVGQRKRVDLARALLHHPKLLVVDEPTANLDQESANLVLRIIEMHMDSRGAVLFSTHVDKALQALASKKVTLGAP